MRYKFPFLLTTMVFALSPSIHAEEEQLPQQECGSSSIDAFTGRVVGTNVRVRTEPSLEGHVVRETTTGEMFAVTKEENGFYAVVPTKGTKGYVFRTFVLDGVVEGARVNVRLYPDIEAPIVGKLNRGDRVQTKVSDINNKWLEVDLSEKTNFYIAKEFIEKCGPIELIAEIEAKQHEAAHKLSSAYLYAQSEVQKSFEHIDLEGIKEKFETIMQEYNTIPNVVEKAREALHVIQDVYVEKKIAFLEGGHNQPSTQGHGINSSTLEKLAKVGIVIPSVQQRKEHEVSETAETVANIVGLASTANSRNITDKMLVWDPLEKSVFHLWAAQHGEKTIEDFYREEALNATVLKGIVEPYNRPVKNRPGDFLLRADNLPVAFLYSTQVNLQDLVGKKVTIMATPRPNNSFAFPAYYVLSVE